MSIKETEPGNSHKKDIKAAVDPLHANQNTYIKETEEGLFIHVPGEGDFAISQEEAEKNIREWNLQNPFIPG